MPYDTVFSDIEGALRVDCKGERNLDDSVELWARVGEVSAARGRKRILVALQLSGEQSVTQTYSLAADYGRFNLTAEHRIAIVNTNPHSYSVSKFGSSVASNRGLPLRTFDNEADALAWLMGDAL